MLRPPPFPHDQHESDDSGSFGGLADVLEPDPDFDDDDDDAVTSLRHLSPASVRSGQHPSLQHPSLRHHQGGPTSVRPPISARPAPPQVQDFAFADTVFSSGDLSDEPPPPSGAAYVNDPFRQPTHCVTPLAFPLLPAAEAVDLGGPAVGRAVTDC